MSRGKNRGSFFGGGKNNDLFCASGYGGGEDFSAVVSARFLYAKRSTAYRYALAIEKNATSKGGAVEFDFNLCFLGERAAKASGVGGRVTTPDEKTDYRKNSYRHNNAGGIYD